MTDVALSSHQFPRSSLTGSSLFGRPAMAERQSDHGDLPTRQHGPETTTSTASVPGGPVSAPASPQGRLTRKRAASIDTHGANHHPRIEDLSLNTPTTLSHSTGDIAKDTCLCTPAPKVPRPRNAFILYRQHHQAQVVAQNPGLANPDVSKIIGEQWNNESEEHKFQWKRLAEEEKQRHQRQFPDYRYQPKRGNKGGTTRPPSAPGEDPGRCPKCGGRYIATPRTPGTPYMTSEAAAHPAMAPFMGHNERAAMEAEHRRRYQAEHNGVMYSDGGGGQHPYTLQAKHPRHEQFEMMPSSPDAKRRRMYNDTRTYNGLSSPVTAAGRFARHPSTSGPAGYQHSIPPPTSGMIPRAHPLGHGHGHPGQGQGSMGPPPPPQIPRQSLSYPQPQYPPHRRSGFDESLTLPPLQTHLPGSPTSDSSAGPSTATPAATTSSVAGPVSQRAREAQSIEAMVMSIPYVNKLKVLEKISPPLAGPSPGSPTVETRGPVIAIEGRNPELVHQVGLIVERVLTASGEFAVHTWSGGGHGDLASERLLRNGNGRRGSERDGSGAGVGTAAVAGTGTNTQVSRLFREYLDTIHGWHSKSDEIIKHVTTVPDESCASGTSLSSTISDASATVTSPADGGGGGQSRAKSPPVPPPLQPPHPRQARVPVALLQGGFSLTVSDRYASTVPIPDSYAPVDHWQWMATLWRGIVGPDLVVYVRGASAAELAKLREAEFKGPSLMAVRCAVPAAGTKASVDEKTERRLGFEVVEWVRGGSFREGFFGPQG